MRHNSLCPAPSIMGKDQAVPGGLNRYNNLSRHTSIESNYLLSIVFEFTEFDLAVGGITVTNCLLTSMKINSAVYSHGCLLLRSQTHTLSLTAHLWGETPFFITSDNNRRLLAEKLVTPTMTLCDS